jgi:Rrf2 family protein
VPRCLPLEARFLPELGGLFAARLFLHPRQPVPKWKRVCQAAALLSQKAKYAIKALLVLARAQGDGRPVQARDISERENIPKKFLDLIFFELRQDGLITSSRGRDGGYALAKPAKKISIAAIVRAVDGPLAPLPCASVKFYRRCDDCDDEKTCAVRRVMREVRDAASAILDNRSLAEAAALERRKPRKTKQQPP